VLPAGDELAGPRGAGFLEIAAMKCSGLAVAALAAGALIAATPARAEPRAVIELFTSQGCSSCPPADKLLGELATDPSLVAISMPIDYWDYLGWKDTLARPRHTARQRGYAGARGDRQVYTPQAVINGVTHVVGSDRNAIEAAIARTSASVRAAALPVPVIVSVKDDHLAISIPAAKQGEQAAEVWLCAVAKAIPVAVGRGENKGRKLTYHNVVRRWVKVGTWNGAEQSWSVPRGEFEAEDSDSIAVLVQAGGVENPGAMLGAAFVSLR
jgi:hypothetical protein